MLLKVQKNFFFLFLFTLLLSVCFQSITLEKDLMFFGEGSEVELSEFEVEKTDPLFPNSKDQIYTIVVRNLNSKVSLVLAKKFVEFKIISLRNRLFSTQTFRGPPSF